MKPTLLTTPATLAKTCRVHSKLTAPPPNDFSTDRIITHAKRRHISDDPDPNPEAGGENPNLDAEGLTLMMKLGFCFQRARPGAPKGIQGPPGSLRMCMNRMLVGENIHLLHPHRRAGCPARSALVFDRHDAQQRREQLSRAKDISDDLGAI